MYDARTVLDDLPNVNERSDLETARVCLARAMTTMTAAGELTAMWEDYATPLIDFTEGEGLAVEVLQTLRCGFEALAGDAECGEYLIAAGKLSVSAFLVGLANPYLTFYPERDEMYDDIHPLANKALGLLYRARFADPFDPTVRIDNSRPEKLGEAMEQNFMRALIDNAVRPKDG